jgi:hypothetical protein
MHLKIENITATQGGTGCLNVGSVYILPRHYRIVSQLGPLSGNAYKVKPPDEN